MKWVCPHCTRTLEISGDPPTFCSYCGLRLSDPGLDATRSFNPDAAETHAFPPRHRPASAVLERVANYRLVRTLGQGGMGTVYEAEDERSGRRVALKLIAAESARSVAAVERFRQEGRLASAIRHPRCVFVLAADEDAGRPYIVMELMPGDTLQRLVQQRGPLPVEDAVLKILDVIEGLEEAHRRGVVHRDVKPSNCFLDAGGRVKVGDFGLSKSLAVDANLTRTGSFVGTPLYASPEQIKGDEVDERTDVYSVAATLYFLLSGQPPFVAKDAMATVARIVLEPPPSLRGLRPELPAGLEAVVQRGLDRDRDRRFQSLAALRSALLPFLPGRMSIGGIGLRVWAHLIDLALFLILSALLGVLLPLILSPQRAERLLERFDPFISLGLDALGVAYFALLEGLWGASLGKWLCGLRVVTADGKAPPGLTRGLLRALTFFLIMVFPDDLLWAYWGEPSGRGGLRETEWDLLLLSTATLATTLAGVLVLIAPMRPHSGFRGTHEWLSGTKVVRLRRARWRRARAAERKLVVPASGSTWSGRPMGVPDQLGPFQIKGAVHWGPQRRVLLGEDPALGRTVWIALRAPDAAPPSPARQELSRLTRLRWLTGGNSPEGRWDAYLAPAGCPLRVLAAEHGLSWADTRPILEDLVEELTLAAQDGTLPPRLDVEDVWVEPDGHPILIDLLENQPGIADPFRFVLQTAALALQGAAGQPDSTTAPRAIRKPLPRHAARLLDRLLGRQPPYGQIAELLDDLRADADLPTEVGRARRAGHLLLQAALLAPGLILLFSVSYLIDAGKLAGLNPHLRGMIVAAGFGWPLLWVLWAGLTRGGLSLRLSSLALVTRDNRPAGFGRCAWRATVVWLPVVGLLVGSILLDRAWPHLAETVRLLWWVALASLPAAVLSALVRPERGPHDRLAGTYLVPQ